MQPSWKASPLLFLSAAVDGKIDTRRHARHVSSHALADTDALRFSGHGGGEYPAREHDDALLAGAGADENAALLVDRSADGRVNGARRDDGDGRVPNLRGNGRVRGAPSNAATLQRSSTEAPARKEAAVLRAIATARAARR